MPRVGFSLFFAVLLALLVPTAAHAADGETPEVPGSLLGTVLKGRAPVAREAQAVVLPRPVSATLPNGLRVLVWEDHRLPWFSCRMLLRAGSLWEPSGGTADVTADLLTEGTTVHRPGALSSLIEQDGGTLNATAAADATVVTLSGLSDYRAPLLDLLAEVVLHPSFPAERLALTKFQLQSVLPQAMRYSNAQIDFVSGLVFYQDSPYAARMPSPEEIAALQSQDLRRFYARTYRPNGAVVGVVGDVDAKDVVARFTRAFGAWRAEPKPLPLPKADFTPPLQRSLFLIDWPGQSDSILSFRSMAVSDRDRDYIPLLVADHILGGTASSRLPQNLRDAHAYTYGVRSHLDAVAWRGLWEASSAVRTDATGPAIRETFRELHRLCAAPVSAAELAEAKRGLIGSFARTLESPDALMERTLVLIEEGQPEDALDRFPAQVQSVTTADIQRVARRYLSQDKMQVIVIGDRRRILLALKRFGLVTKIN